MDQPPPEDDKRRAPAASAIPAELAAECLIHELRQPMLGLRASLGFLSRELGTDVQHNEDWQVVLAHLSRMEELFSTYRDLLGETPPEPVTFDAGAVAERAVALLGHRLRSLADGFTFSVADDLWSVHGSPSALLHGLLNLLKNALEALLMRPESGHVALRLYNGPDGRVEVRVSNDGPPVPPEDRARIFEPRVTTKERAGGGLGLFVARSALARYGAALLVVDDADPQRLDWAGVELAIRLPRPPAAATREDGAEPPRRRDRKKRRALVVDDDDVVRSVIEMALTTLGFEVATVATGPEALAELRGAPFDVVVLDKNLEAASGVEIAHAARASDPHLAILMVTGYASAESAEALLESDIDYYLCKPFEVPELTAAVEEALDRRRAQAEGFPRGVAPSGREATLVISEPAIDRERLAEALGEIGYRCRYFEDLRVALAHEPEAGLLVVSDAHFHHAERQLLVERRRDFPEGRVIIVSSSHGVDVRVGAILVGARLVLPVPLPAREQLLERLREALGRP